MWKVPAISAIASVVFFVVTKIMIANMSTQEQFNVVWKEKYPKRITIMSILWFLSSIVAVISMIVWIVKA